MNPIASFLKNPKKPIKAANSIHTELHDFIETTRKEWRDVLSFGRWLGTCKKIPLTVLYQIRGSVRDSNAKSPAKLFFFKVREWRKLQARPNDV